jgi:hypothetical protein
VILVSITLDTMDEGQRLAQLLIERQLTNFVGRIDVPQVNEVFAAWRNAVVRP